MFSQTDKLDHQLPGVFNLTSFSLSFVSASLLLLAISYVFTSSRFPPAKHTCSDANMKRNDVWRVAGVLFLNDVSLFSHIRTECARDQFHVRFLLEGRSDLENI